MSFSSVTLICSDLDPLVCISDYDIGREDDLDLRVFVMRYRRVLLYSDRNVMLLSMRHHGRPRNESFTAFAALVRPLAGVQALVNCHRAELRERLAADVAFVRTLARMRSPMAS